MMIHRNLKPAAQVKPLMMPIADKKTDIDIACKSWALRVGYTAR